ncbi:MAG: aconitase family protein, partial [Planctomycetota bacterium]
MARSSSSRSVFQKILAAHLEGGDVVPGRTVSIRIDQTLTGDASAATCYLEFEAIGVDRVATEVSVSHADATTDPADRPYLESVAARHGIHFSRPESGSAHHVHLERFAVPGKSLLGTDSRVVACGALAMLALEGSNLVVAAAMGG